MGLSKDSLRYLRFRYQMRRRGQDPRPGGLASRWVDSFRFAGEDRTIVEFEDDSHVVLPQLIEVHVVSPVEVLVATSVDGLVGALGRRR